MRITKRGERVAIAAAVVGGIALGMTAQIWNPYTRHLDADLAQQTLFVCETVDATQHTDDAVALLIAAGWTADPTDHAERLYSPACNR